MPGKTASWLDSSALLALFHGEAGTNVVRELLEASERDRALVYFSAISLTEVVSSLSKIHGENAGRDELHVILSMPAKIESPSRDQFVEAGWLRSRHRLSTTDAIIAIQAMGADAELVHKDPEFELVLGLKQRPLPYKTKGIPKR